MFKVGYNSELKLNLIQELGPINLIEQNLGSPVKILSCEFFLIRWKCIF